MKKVVTAFFALSLVFNLILSVVLFYQNYSLPVAGALNNFETPGTYGPPAMEIIDGDATISTAGVTLQNTLITGNLYLTHEIDEGTITLDRVEVQGEVIVSGSGFTLLLEDSSLDGITQEEGGDLTIIAKGKTDVDMVILSGEASLQEDSLAEDAGGFKDVQVKTNQGIILLGGFASLDIAAGDANVRILKGSAVNISIQGSAANTNLELAKDVQVEILILGAISTLTGNGSVETVEVNVPGLTKLQGVLGEVSCQAEGIFLELHAGSIAKLIVPELENATSIHLVEETIVELMELNARTGVTGQGQIDTAKINQPGVTLDLTPGKIILAEGITATVNGEEYKEPEPEPEPEYVKIHSISNMSLMEGKSGTRSISVTPSSASLKVKSSNTSVATASISGKKVTVTGKKSGTAKITVTGESSDYEKATRTFTVTVNAPSDVKKFELKTSFLVGHELVWVTLYASDPSAYKVSVGGVELKYRADAKLFFGDVPTADAKQSKVKVSKK